MDKGWERWFWAGGGALIWSILLGVATYMRSPAFVRTTRLEEMNAIVTQLRFEVEDLRKHCERCDAQLAQANERIDLYRDENQWLLRQLRNAEDRDLRRDEANVRRDDEIKRRDENKPRG